MANGMFGGGKLALASGNVDWINASFSALLVDLSHYSPDLADDISLADIPEAAIVATANINGKALSLVEIAGEIFCQLIADNVVFNSVPEEGKEVTAIVIALNAETFSGSTLLFIWDDVSQFPVTPDGTDITIEWDTGDNRVFRF